MYQSIAAVTSSLAWGKCWFVDIYYLLVSKMKENWSFCFYSVLCWQNAGYGNWQQNNWGAQQPAHSDTYNLVLSCHHFHSLFNTGNNPWKEHYFLHYILYNNNTGELCFHVRNKPSKHILFSSLNYLPGLISLQENWKCILCINS